jgi:hypothetical protein
MLDYRTLTFKPLMIQDGKETFMDLLAPVYKTDYSPQGRVIIVNQYYVSRPDLISLAVYGDDKYGDIICKLNGISNPFELNENDVIYAPALEYVMDCVKNYGEESEIIKNPQQDMIKNVKPDNKQKRVNETRTPNEQLLGDKSFIIDRSMGMVFY